jgi:Ran GTPase-activating protein (RanGAP) involved in mRNA processing and transport
MAIAAQPPSEAGWASIVSLARRFNEAEVDALDGALSAWPVDMRVAPRNWGVTIPELGDQPFIPPAFRVARKLAIANAPLGTKDIEALIASPYLDRLTSVELHGNGLELPAIRALSEASHLTSMEQLSISGENITDEGVEVLLAGKLRPLCQLDLEANALSDDALIRLARAASTSALATLAFHGNAIGDEGLSALAQSKHLSKLTTLVGSYNQVGAAGLSALFQTELLPELAVLRLARNHCGDAGVETIVSSSRFARVRELNLSENQLSFDAVKALAESPHVGRLEVLALGYNDLDVASARSIASSPSLLRLRSLGVAGSKIGPEGAAILARAPWTALQTLDLRDNELDDAAARAIAESGIVARLTSLQLGLNAIGEAGEDAILRAAGSRTQVSFEA